MRLGTLGKGVLCKLHLQRSLSVRINLSASGTCSFVETQLSLICKSAKAVQTELSISRDLFNLEVALVVEADGALYCINHDLCCFPLHCCCCMILDVPCCHHKEWYHVNMHHINCQDNILIVVLYVLWHRAYIQLYSRIIFPHHFTFRPGILEPRMVCSILASLGVTRLFGSWLFCAILRSCQ